MAARLERPSAAAAPTRPGRPVVRVESVGGRRRSRISEIVVGIVVVAVCALGVVVWHSSASSTEAVLVLARPMHAGEPLDAAALRAEPVHVGATVGHVPAADLHRMVGKVAAADLAQGTLVSDSLFIGRPPVPAGSTVVAAALAPGQFATFQLRPGQAVAAIRTGGQPAATGATDENAGAGTVLAHATVYEIRTLSDTAGTWIVSLLVPEASAPAVASAAAAKALSLALVAGRAS
jgi:SAF domain